MAAMAEQQQQSSRGGGGGASSRPLPPPPGPPPGGPPGRNPHSHSHSHSQQQQPPPPPQQQQQLQHQQQQQRGPPGPPLMRPRFEPVDREKICPLLLRVFTKIGSHHTKEDFAVRGKEPKDEVQIYTWKDATLRELTDLVKEVAPAARRRDAKLSFAFVYPDKNGRFVVKQVGTTHSYGNGRRLDDAKALAELKFEIGDYLDVAIL